MSVALYRNIPEYRNLFVTGLNSVGQAGHPARRLNMEDRTTQRTTGASDGETRDNSGHDGVERPDLAMFDYSARDEPDTEGRAALAEPDSVDAWITIDVDSLVDVGERV